MHLIRAPGSRSVMSTLVIPSKRKTAFVLAGGGSVGAVQVGMLRALLENGVDADLVVGSSAGVFNAAYFAEVTDPPIQAKVLTK